jgi:hypothetical protein
MAAVVQGNSIIFENRKYAVLDGTSPVVTEYGYQKDFLPLPDDWEFAPTEPAIVSEVIHKYPWGTLWLVCGDGQCHTTSKNTLQGQNVGRDASSYKKITKRRDTYRPALNFSAMDLNAFRILESVCIMSAHQLNVASKCVPKSINMQSVGHSCKGVCEDVHRSRRLLSDRAAAALLEWPREGDDSGGILINTTQHTCSTKHSITKKINTLSRAELRVLILYWQSFRLL